MNKQFFLLLTAIALVPGCGPFRSKKAEKRAVNKKEVLTDVDIPVAGDGVKSYFDQDIDELTLSDKSIAADDSQYAWIDQNSKISNGFKKVHFGFNEYNIKASEKEAVAQDVARMRDLIALEENGGTPVQFVINGNADHAAGSDTYNRILSEKRAKVLKDQAIAAGIPSEKIKIVGRGSDVPVIVNGRPCTGDKDQQAPNRRDEIQVIAA